ncbi:hypothetical protein OOJ91_34145 [Micromonospora lupini]|uniref:hypothetical protein n=1 Tax=Micromonospora lupini TaxID=285679 RepID=UPI0022577B3C|nr:hypothetical protein [Micromonospora lupini]MCX5070891.1 hypothetical protein [Micromonospora lupini]
MSTASSAIEQLRIGLADRGITVPDTDDPTDAVTAALDAIDHLRRPIASIANAAAVGVHLHFTPRPPERVLVPVPYDPRTGRMLA